MKVSSQFHVPATLASGKTKPGAPEPVLTLHTNIVTTELIYAVLQPSSVCSFLHF